MPRIVKKIDMKTGDAINWTKNYLKENKALTKPDKFILKKFIKAMEAFKKKTIKGVVRIDERRKHAVSMEKNMQKVLKTQIRKDKRLEKEGKKFIELINKKQYREIEAMLKEKKKWATDYEDMLGLITYLKALKKRIEKF